MKKRTSTFMTVSAVAVASLLGACDRRPGAVIDTAAGTVDSAARATISEYTDAELLGLLMEGANGYVEPSTYAQQRATNVEVKAFARQVLANHKTDSSEIASVAKALNVTPTVPANDEDVIEDRVEGMKRLRETPVGSGFDEAYLEYQVSMHRKVLDEINDALDRGPVPELRALLGTLRTTLQADLIRAEELEKKYYTADEVGRVR